MTMRWGEKRYYSLDYYLKENYGEKIYKISLNGGFTCPNRDGSLSDRGCIFCSQGGSGDFAEDASASISDQIEAGKKQSAAKYRGTSYIAYFQAYTNTYASVEYLRKIFMEAILHPDIKILSIATRPDCLGQPVLSLLEELAQIKPVWIELGLQSIHPSTARFIRRGYELPVFEDAVRKLDRLGIPVIVHTILGLPGETEEMMLETVAYLNHLPIAGIKFQLLHVLKFTDLAEVYKRKPFHIYTMEEYLSLLGKCICGLNPNIVIHRLTGDGPASLLIAPTWTLKKRHFLNQLGAYLKREDLWQGKEIL